MSSKALSNFRYDINALRAMAVLGVLFYHFKIGPFLGGFSGVDIFFVISGYLMTKIISSSIEKQEFSFKDYIGKRIKRIVPALLFLVLIVTIISFFLYFPDDFKINQKNAAGSVLFLSNILYWRTSNYFAPSAESNLFLHTWSLSVEWQFYLLFPFLLLLLSRILKKRGQYLLFFASSTFILFIVSSWITSIKPVPSFFLLPTRAWEMMMGGVAFFGEGFVKNGKWNRVLALVGYALMLGCILFLRTAMPWPSGYTALPVLATFFVIIANDNSFKLINSAVIQFIGKISYSLYLWHWPVYVIAQYFGIGTGWVASIAFIVASFLLGYISFRYIETIKFMSSKPIFAFLIMVFAGTASLSIFNSNNILYKEKSLKVAGYRAAHQKELYKQFNRGVCHVEKMGDFNVKQCLAIAEGKKNILIVGDSHIGQIAECLRARLAERNINMLQATGSATLPTLKDSPEGDKVRELMDFIFYDFVPKNRDKIDGVILGGYFAGRDNISEENALKSIKEVIQYLEEHGINVIVLGQTEAYTIPYPLIAARDYEYDLDSERLFLNDYNFQLDSYLRKNLSDYYVKIINSDSLPPISSKGEPYVTDEHHVSKYGADLLVDKIFSDSVAIRFFKN